MEPITRKELFMAKAAGENVNVPDPITREEKYLKYMADNSVSKYFGESTEVVFDQTVELEGGDAMLSTPLGLVEGQTYKVTFDGTTYDCIAEMFSTDGTTKLGVYIGSLEQSEYPFTIVEFVPEMAEQVGGLVSISADLEDASVNTSATVKIEKSVIHPIDPKFLPGKVVYTFDESTDKLLDVNGNEVTVEQARKDAFNVVIFGFEGDVYRVPTSIQLGDGYVAFEVYLGGGSDHTLSAGEMPR